MPSFSPVLSVSMSSSSAKRTWRPVSGVSAARIQEIVGTGRQALSTASPKRREQHLVSQALLRRFCVPTSQGERLLSYNLQFGRTRLLPTAQVGKLANFVKIDSEATEQLWGRH